MRDGRYVDTVPADEMPIDRIISLMVGRTIYEATPEVPEHPSEDVVLEVRHLNRGRLVRDVSFQLRRGEILGFAGLVGAGRTEVARVIFGIDRADAGEIRIGNESVHISSPKVAMQHGLAYVPEDRRQQGLVMDFSIAANMTLPILQRVSRLGVVDRQREREIATSYSQQLRVRSAGIDQLVKALSGGNQQK